MRCFTCARRSNFRSRRSLIRWLSDPPLTPLQQAAVDYREDLAQRLENAEKNEHVRMPGLDADSVVDVLSDRKIKAAMASGQFDSLSGKGRPLDPFRPVGDILVNANVVPPWVEKIRELDAALLAASSEVASRNNGIDLEPLLKKLNDGIRECNKCAPPQLQRSLITAEYFRRRSKT